MWFQNLCNRLYTLLRAAVAALCQLEMVLQLQMLSHSPCLDSTTSALISRLPPSFSVSSTPYRGYNSRRIFSSCSYSTLKFSAISRGIRTMTRNSLLSNHTGTSGLQLPDSELDLFADVGNKVADASGDVIRKYFRKTFDILDKDDLSELLEIYVCANILVWSLNMNKIPFKIVI